MGLVMMGKARNQKDIFRYMEKYMRKDYGTFRDYNPEWTKLRRFGCSRLGVYGYCKEGLEFEGYI